MECQQEGAPEAPGGCVGGAEVGRVLEGPGKGGSDPISDGVPRDPIPPVHTIGQFSWVYLIGQFS